MLRDVWRDVFFLVLGLGIAGIGIVLFGDRFDTPEGSPGPTSNSAGLMRKISTPAAVVKNETPPTGDIGRIIPAVVRVTGPNFAGSGVIIEESGKMLTSAHVVGRATQINVGVADAEYVNGLVVRTDPRRDLALVQLPKGSYVAAPLASGAPPSLGSRIVVIGYPLDLPGSASVTTGVVSRPLDEPELNRKLLQTDAVINPGNSGGPIVDSQGLVIGIVASIMGEYRSVPARGISFAVSAETIRDFLQGQ